MLDAGRAPRSAQYMLAVVRQVFNFADTHDIYLGPNPTKKVKIKVGDNRRQRFLSQEEAARLLEACKARSQDVHDLCLLSLHTGMRAGECFNLEWRDVDFGQGILTLRNTKNGSTRYAYMTGAVRDILQARRSTGTADKVFPGRAEVSDTFKRVVDALGFNRGISDRSRKIVFHSLRHTFASWLAMQGTPIFTIAKLMGHKTTAMSERYSHLSPGHLQEVVRGFEAGLNKPKVVDIITGEDHS
jgi:integrase